MELLIVRHGETIANLKNQIQGQTDGSLSRKGKLQAKDLSRRLRNKKIDRIFSSDLNRARETACEIIKNKDIPTYYMKWLRGRDSGIYEGKKWDQVVKEIGQNKAFDDVHFKFGGGESMIEMHARIKKLMKAVMKNHGSQTVVICTHRHCITVLMSVLFNVPIGDVLAHMKNVKNGQIVGNTEVVRLLVERGGVDYKGNNQNILDIMEMSKSQESGIPLYILML
jgi:broad specificity phosphatase PhoE